MPDDQFWENERNAILQRQAQRGNPRRMADNAAMQQQMPTQTTDQMNEQAMSAGLGPDQGLGLEQGLGMEQQETDPKRAAMIRALRMIQ